MNQTVRKTLWKNIEPLKGSFSKKNIDQNCCQNINHSQVGHSDSGHGLTIHNSKFRKTGGFQHLSKTDSSFCRRLHYEGLWDKFAFGVSR